MDRGAWQDTVHGAAKSQMRLTLSLSFRGTSTGPSLSILQTLQLSQADVKMLSVF